MSDVMIKFYENQIKDLEERLSEYYKVKVPEDYGLGSDQEGKVNVAKKLEEFYHLENVYSAIEDGNPEGEIYDKYSGYLIKVRESKKFLEEEISRINEEHAAEIKNTEIMIRSFENEMTKYKQNLE